MYIKKIDIWLRSDFKFFARLENERSKFVFRFFSDKREFVMFCSFKFDVTPIIYFVDKVKLFEVLDFKHFLGIVTPWTYFVISIINTTSVHLIFFIFLFFIKIFHFIYFISKIFSFFIFYFSFFIFYLFIFIYYLFF